MRQNSYSWTVRPEETGLTLRQLLAAKLTGIASGKTIKRALDEGKCFLNGHLERFPNTLLGAGDSVELSLPNPKSACSLPLLWQDDYYFAIDKPAGQDIEEIARNPKILAISPEAKLVHRLDKDTTGVLLFGKNEETAKRLSHKFRMRQVRKVYIAIVKGGKQACGCKTSRLVKKGTFDGQAIWGSTKDPKGVEAITNWECVWQGSDYALCYCYPVTGRTHQIRVHLAEIGMPLVGDKMYGREVKSPLQADRCLLHCYRMTFPHPYTLYHTRSHNSKFVPEDSINSIEVIAPVPEDMKRLIPESYLVVEH